MSDGMTLVYIFFSGYYREVESIHATFDNAHKALIALRKERLDVKWRDTLLSFTTPRDEPVQADYLHQPDVFRRAMEIYEENNRVLNTPGELEKELAPYVSTVVRLNYEPDKEYPDNPAMGTWTPVDENEDAYSYYSIEGYEVVE